MRQLMTQHRSTAAARGGFSLIEMLVATTLVVMMMLMFAQMYTAAVGSLTEQQAVARNDGKTRLADTLIRADLRRMSFQSAPGSSQGLLPLVNGEEPDEWQKGYFYLSENDQTNPVDDVLQFTTRITGNIRNPDQSTYFGRSKSVPGLAVGAFPNHPDVDDGDNSNQVGASRSAEVSYFVRNGNLYRRVLLLRDVDLQAGGISTPAQPSNPTTLTEFSTTIAPNSGTGAPSFYKAFDYAAFCRVRDASDASLDITRFIGTDSLENRSGSNESIGRSMNRFGFAMLPGNQTATNADPVLQAITRSRGLPVEYDSLGNFFGRPIHAETGSYLWGWPGTRYNPLLDANLKYGFTKVDQLSFQGTDTPIVDTVTNPALANYTRATEDLLLANVEAFDVEVWDQGLVEMDLDSDGNLDPDEDLNSNGVFDVAGGFVQLGHSGVTKNLTTTPTGYFRDAARRDGLYGPGTDPNGVNANVPTRNWVFDTGHPDMWTEAPRSLVNPFAAYGAAQRPAYRPLLYRVVERDINSDGNADPNEDLNGNNVLDTALPANPVRGANVWYPGQVYSSGAVVFRPLDLSLDLDTGNVTTSGVVYRPQDSTYSIAYRCVASGEDLDGDGVLDGVEDDGVGDNGDGNLDYGTSSLLTSSGKEQFQWPSVPGQRVTDGGVTWEAFDNRVGLQKIRITVRLRDAIEGLPRQFSIVHSFANPKYN